MCINLNVPQKFSKLWHHSQVIWEPDDELKKIHEINGTLNNYELRTYTLGRYRTVTMQHLLDNYEYSKTWNILSFVLDSRF